MPHFATPLFAIFITPTPLPHVAIIAQHLQIIDVKREVWAQCPRFDVIDHEPVAGAVSRLPPTTRAYPPVAPQGRISRSLPFPRLIKHIRLALLDHRSVAEPLRRAKSRRVNGHSVLPAPLAGLCLALRAICRLNYAFSVHALTLVIPSPLSCRGMVRVFPFPSIGGRPCPTLRPSTRLSSARGGAQVPNPFGPPAAHFRLRQRGHHCRGSTGLRWFPHPYHLTGVARLHGAARKLGQTAAL
jgi:hypothetical protein